VIVNAEAELISFKGRRAAYSVVEYLGRKIQKHGQMNIGGIEQEIQGLESDWKHPFYDTYDQARQLLLRKLPAARDAIYLPRKSEFETKQERLKRQAGETFREDLFLSGKAIISNLGALPPEVQPIFELAHMPASNSWDIRDQSQRFSAALKQVAREKGLMLIGAGAVPTMSWQDFRHPDALSPFPHHKSWADLMTNDEKPEQCRTVFGTASVHCNIGFKDPERMTRYARAALRLQPTMIALLGNAPLWDGQPYRQDGRDILSYRSHVQLAYGDSLAIGGMNYLYPDFLLDPKAKFHDIVLGYMNLPLVRTTLPEGNHRLDVECGDMTMMNYLEGYEYGGKTYHPDEVAMNEMIRDMVVDVRPSMMVGPRVETRAHDSVSEPVAVALDAFYRGLEQNLDDFHDLMIGMNAHGVRWQRQQVCWDGLQSRLRHTDDTIHDQQDLALRVLRISEKGLRERGLQEETLLAPLWVLADSGVNPAQRMLKAWHRARGDFEQFFEATDYYGPTFADGEAYDRPSRPMPLEHAPAASFEEQLEAA
jgi:gamma-glutamylcysteine synthetase